LKHISYGTLEKEKERDHAIAVNKLLRILEDGGCKVVAYADNVAIIFNGKYPQTLCDLMPDKLKIL